MIKLTYEIECEDERVAHIVQDHISANGVLAIDGVTTVKATWLAPREPRAVKVD